jgi:hypothetical protein
MSDYLLPGNAGPQLGSKGKNEKLPAITGGIFHETTRFATLLSTFEF